MNDWTLWAVERPTDTKALYRWRVPERRILGKMLRPEWSAKLASVGMGYGDNEWWPGFSDWNGATRSVPVGTEWRLAREDEPEGKIAWVGLDLLPSPFTGKPPKVDYHGQYVTAPPFKPQFLILTSYMIDSRSWDNAQHMQDAWNYRPETKK